MATYLYKVSVLNITGMTRVHFAICLIILFAVLYFAAPFIGMPSKFVVALCVIAPFALSGISYMVLKYGQPSDQRFDEE